MSRSVKSRLDARLRELPRMPPDAPAVGCQGGKFFGTGWPPVVDQCQILLQLAPRVGRHQHHVYRRMGKRESIPLGGGGRLAMRVGFELTWVLLLQNPGNDRYSQAFSGQNVVQLSFKLPKMSVFFRTICLGFLCFHTYISFGRTKIHFSSRGGPETDFLL